MTLEMRLRDLRRDLDKIAAYLDLDLNQPLTLRQTMSEPSVGNLIKVEVAKYFRINPDLMYSKKRDAYLVWPRHVAMFLCYDATPLTYTETSRLFKVHHAAVMHAVKRVKERIETERRSAKCVAVLREHIIKKIHEHFQDSVA